ncbi:periplasmic sensor signal transduction histidine kinase [Desulfuromonas acetoxidans DSM 684]|uniref:histidine kinase n=2 Tax=Desulfuromonas acetoxidans TaxID=891 RepID=Q1JYW8_DESA6|nr:periplasmic sensor signal transduction histidine kinase [Desulfuromonas acetoxidans DSM 684]
MSSKLRVSLTGTGYTKDRSPIRALATQCGSDFSYGFFLLKTISLTMAIILGVTLCATRLWAAPKIEYAGPFIDKPPVIIGGMQDFPPYEFLDKNGTPSGFNVELTRAIARVMEMNVEIQLGNWNVMRQALVHGDIDALQGLNFSAERTKEVDFSPPHSVVQYSIWSRSGTPKISQLSEIQEKTVVVLKGSISDELLQSAGINNLIRADSYGEALRLVASEKYDYLAAAKLPIQALSSTMRLVNIVPMMNIDSLPYSYAVKRGNLALMGKFSEGLAILKKTGEYQKIHHRWLGVLEPQALPIMEIIKYATPVVGTLLLIIFVIVLWSRMLKKQVAQRTAALAHEISERERAMKELQHHQKQLIQADKMASLGILVAGVAHEINNPIGGILLGLPTLHKAHEMASSCLEERYRESGDFTIGGLRYSIMREEVPLLFDEMVQGAKRIKHIVEDLKDFSRTIDPTCTTPLDLNTIVKTSVRLAEHTIKKTTDSFVENYTESLPKIYGCSQRLEQIVINLILNACQALEHRGQSITLRTYHINNEVRLEVKDQGVGIPKEHFPHLTDPFFTTKREVGGTGLGLSISAGIVKEHGGQLKFNSTPGKGTKVTLALPVAKENAA